MNGDTIRTVDVVRGIRPRRRPAQMEPQSSNSAREPADSDDHRSSDQRDGSRIKFQIMIRLTTFGPLRTTQRMTADHSYQ